MLFSFSASGRPGTPRLGWSESLVWGERGVAGGVNGCVVFFQTCSRTHSDHLPVVDSPQCWGMVSCSWLSLSDLSTLSHWKRIGSLAYRNNSSLLLWSRFPVCIRPVYTIFYPPSCKHLLWLDGAFWVLQWTTVCHCCRWVLVGMHISAKNLMYEVTVSVSSSRSVTAASKTVQSVRSNRFISPSLYSP